MTNEVFYYLCFTCFLYLEYIYSPISIYFLVPSTTNEICSYISVFHHVSPIPIVMMMNHQPCLFGPCYVSATPGDFRREARQGPRSPATRTLDQILGGAHHPKIAPSSPSKFGLSPLNCGLSLSKFGFSDGWGNLPKTYDFIDGPTPLFIRRGFGMHSSQQAFLSKPLVFVCVSSVFFQNPYLYARVFL